MTAVHLPLAVLEDLFYKVASAAATVMLTMLRRSSYVQKVSPSRLKMGIGRPNFLQRALSPPTA